MKPRNGAAVSGVLTRKNLLLDQMVVGVAGRVLTAEDHPEQLRAELFTAATLGLAEAVGLLSEDPTQMMVDLLARMSYHAIEVSRLPRAEKNARQRAIDKKYRRMQP